MSGVRLMGFWAKQSQDGKDYHEGTLGGAQVRLFVNEYKKSEKDPDVIMYISARPKEGERRAPPPKPNAPSRPKITPRPQPQNAAPQKTAYMDHTIPQPGWDPEDPGPSDPDLPF